MVVIHPDIWVWRPELYRDDGVHLSELELDLQSLWDLQRGLWAEIFSEGGEHGAYE